MKSRMLILAGTLTCVAVLALGCAPSTAAPTKKADYPQKDRAITYIVPWAAGGGTDIAARLFSSYMEKDLGVPITVVNKPGAEAQIGTTELAKAKADGYTIGDVDLWSCILSYLQPERQSAFARKDFAPIRMLFYYPSVWIVKADSPFKSIKDLVDAAKAKPATIKVSDTGLMGSYHLAGLLFAKVAGIKLVPVHFDGAAPAMTALMGGHVDIGITSAAAAMSPVKSGQARLLGVADTQRSKFFPDAPTFEEQGYKGYALLTSHTLAAPAGVPQEVVDVLGAAVKKAQSNPDLVKKADESGLGLPADKGPKEVNAEWDDVEKIVKETLELAKQGG